MSKITLETIQDELNKYNWRVLSSTYTNLDTEMVFECDEGHKVYSTWKKIRQKRECPMCMSNIYNLGQGDVPEISKDYQRRYLALDQATHITGWAVFDDNKLIRYGTFVTNEYEEADRIYEIKQWLVSMIHNWSPDLIGIEGIQYQPQSGVTTFQTLARLQGVLIETCKETKILYKICPTNTWRSFCEVKGRARTDKKRSMQMQVKKWYDISVNDDVADAIGIGKYISEINSCRGDGIKIVDWVKEDN